MLISMNKPGVCKAKDEPPTTLAPTCQGWAANFALLENAEPELNWYDQNHGV